MIGLGTDASLRAQQDLTLKANAIAQRGASNNAEYAEGSISVSVNAMYT